jgi:hypothetical protein
VKFPGPFDFGQAQMDDPNGSGSSRDRRLILAALVGLGLGLVIAGIAYSYSDDLTAFIASLTGEKLGRPQGRMFHY